MTDKLVIMVVQSRTTGRFLLKCENDEWQWPAQIVDDPNVAVVYVVLQETEAALGFDHRGMEDVCLDYIDDPMVHQVFHMWVDGEPMGNIKGEWASMFMFPENTHLSIDIVLGSKMFLEKSISPDT